MAQDAAVKPVILVPIQVPLPLAELARRVPQWVKSDAVNYSDTGTVNLFEIPGNVLITNMLVRVKTAFEASGTSAAATATITIPNDTGTETIWDAANTALQSSGFKPTTGWALTPDSGGFAILTYTAGTTTAGQLEVYLSYVPASYL